MAYAKLDLDQVVMPKGKPEITLGVNSRKSKALFRIVMDTESSHELDLRRFEIAEHGGVVNSAAGIRIDEADSRAEDERLRHRLLFQASVRWLPGLTVPSVT